MGSKFSGRALLQIYSAVSLFFMSSWAVADLYVDQYMPGSSDWRIYGDVDSGRYRVSDESKASLMAGGVYAGIAPIQWPTRNGVWIFPLYKSKDAAFMPPTQPLYAGANLTINEVSDGVLPVRLKQFMWGGMRLPYLDLSNIYDIGLAICDYYVNKATWACKGAKVGEKGVDVPNPPVEAVSCNMSGSINLRHGNVELRSVEGNRATAAAYVTCTQKINVTVKIASGTQGTVQLSGVTGVRSELSVNGIGGGQAATISASSSSTPVRFESVLRASGNVTSGAFQGSSYAVLELP